MRRVRAWVVGWAAGAALALAGGPVAGDPTDGCPTEVRQAMTSWGRDGVHRAAAVIRSEATGIGEPESVFDFSCLTDLFRFPGLHVFIDPTAVINAILRAIQNFVCDVGDRLFRENIDRPIQEMVFWDDLPYVPGVDVNSSWRDKVNPPEVAVRPGEGISAGRGSYGDASWFRHAIGGS